MSKYGVLQVKLGPFTPCFIHRCLNLNELKFVGQCIFHVGSSYLHHNQCKYRLQPEIIISRIHDRGRHNLYPRRCDLHQDFRKPKAMRNSYANQTEWDITCIFHGHDFSLLYQCLTDPTCFAVEYTTYNPTPYITLEYICVGILHFDLNI